MSSSRPNLPEGTEAQAPAERPEPEDVQADEARVDEAQPTLLTQMGGISGLVYSSLPVLVFIAVNAVWGLRAAIWASLSAAVAITLWRLVRREALQPAISGFLGVAVAAFIAYRTGSAKGFFLFGIWTSLVYGGAFLLSAVVRWPLVGVAWSALNGAGMGWRSDRSSRLGYDIATMVWALVFLARFVVQRWLYEADLTGWLAVARLGMGYPLTAVALLVTVWAVRRADRRRELATRSADVA